MRPPPPRRKDVLWEPVWWSTKANLAVAPDDPKARHLGGLDARQLRDLRAALLQELQGLRGADLLGRLVGRLAFHT